MSRTVQKGMPLFSPAEREKIVKEFLASGDANKVAAKWGTTNFNIYRWTRIWKKKHPGTDQAGSVGSSPAGAQYSLPKDALGELERLREENRRLHETIGRLYMERDRLNKPQ